MAEQLKGEVIPIKELKVPDVLYKYRCFGNKYHEKALYEYELYIPSPDGFNDPFDSKIPFRYEEKDLTEDNIRKKTFEMAQKIQPNKSRIDQEELAIRMQNDHILDDEHNLEDFDKVTFKSLCTDYGIYCLTPDEKNLLMWSYYADSHKGFCIGYNAKYLVECGLFGLGGEILYTNEFPKMPLFATETDNSLIKLLFTKWDIWAHEKEYRLVHRYKNSKKHTLEQEAISEIILGCMVPDNQRIAFVNAIKDILPNIKIYQIEQSKNGFGLEKKTVLDDKLFLTF